jgi:hypothetical protein
LRGYSTYGTSPDPSPKQLGCSIAGRPERGDEASEDWHVQRIWQQSYVWNIGNFAKKFNDLFYSAFGQDKRSMTIFVIFELLAKVAVDAWTPYREQTLHQNALGKFAKSKRLNIGCQSVEIAGVALSGHRMKSVENFFAPQCLPIIVHPIKYVAKGVIVVARDNVHRNFVVTYGRNQLIGSSYLGIS